MVRIRKKWLPEEEEALRAGVDKYGPGKWNAILKDQELGEILISRSNVDLKDKWRNIEPVTNESHFHNGVRCVLGDAPNTVKQRDMSLCIGASDSQVIDANPLRVVSATSATSEPGCIERPRSRLNNQILDAEAKAKETYGYSHNTAIVPYVEKRAAELQITVGKKVEVSFKKDDYSVWFPATVLEDFEDNSYLVRYLGKKGSKASSRGAIVSLPDIRPQPPPHKSRSFVLLDKVDAFCGVAWTRGLIIKEFADKRFMVSFKHFENQVFSETELRPHMEWINGKWVDASKSREAYNDAQLRSSKKCEIANAAEKQTSTACETDTMNSTPPSKQHSSQETKTPISIHCPTDVAVTETPGKGHSSLKTDIKVANEKNIGEHSDASKVVKKRGRTPKIYEKNSTSAPENVKRRRTPKTDESSTSGVKAAEGIKERDCEKEDIAPTPRDHISCQSLIEGSQAITSDQKGQGHVPARLIIKERADNSLSKHNGTSPELLEPRNRMEISMKSNEKVKCKVPIEKLFKCYVREGGKRSADLSAETAHLNLDGKVSNACVGTAEGTEEKDCETQDTPILVGCKGTKNVQDNNPSQSPPEGSKNFISDQNGQGNVLARQTIKERAKSNLGKQKRTSPELSEPMSRMEKPTELSEKAKCQVSSDELRKRCLREGGTRIAELFAESSLSVVDGVSLKETDGNQTFPFEKTKLLWDTIESMEEFQLYPQKPHFSSLKDIDEDRREGEALAQMVTFSKIVKKISEPNGFTENVLEKLNMLENNGFDVRMIRDHLNDFLENNLKKQESRIMELKRRKTMIDEEVDETERKLKNLRAIREAAMSKIEVKEAAIEASKSLLNSINDRIESVQHDFEEIAAAPL